MGFPVRILTCVPSFKVSLAAISHTGRQLVITAKLEQLPFNTKIPEYQYIRCNLLIRETQDTWLDLDPGSRPLGILCSAVGFKVEIRIGIRRIMVLQSDFWSLLKE